MDQYNGIPTLQIVVNIIEIEDGKFVFIQEAKPSCFGQWSLPGGLREPSESIFAACIREVQEETGILVEPFKILKIEHLRYEQKELSAPREKFRYIVLSRYISGSLKQICDADSESICAKSYSLEEVASLNLREPACIDLLKMTRLNKDACDTIYEFHIFT